MDAFLEYGLLYSSTCWFFFTHTQIQSFTLGYSYQNNKRSYIPETVSKMAYRAMNENII